MQRKPCFIREKRFANLRVAIRSQQNTSPLKIASSPTHRINEANAAIMKADSNASIDRSWVSAKPEDFFKPDALDGDNNSSSIFPILPDSTYVSDGVQSIQGQTVINVLIVDDSKFVASAIHSILVEMDFHVVGLAHDGLQGLAHFEEHSPDVTLLDITMPNMDGIECLMRIRELNSDARVVMLSAIQDEATIKRCLAAGAAGFLQKPIRKTSPADLERLCEMLEQAAGKVS